MYVAAKHEIQRFVSYCILLMQVADANKWVIASSVGHTFICVYQRSAYDSLESL